MHQTLVYLSLELHYKSHAEIMIMYEAVLLVEKLTSVDRGSMLRALSWQNGGWVCVCEMRQLMTSILSIYVSFINENTAVMSF